MNLNLEFFFFSDQGLRVPTIKSRWTIGPRGNLSWIIETCKVYLSSNQCKKQNPKIVLKTKEIQFSSKFAQKMKFHENRGSFELKLNIKDVIK